MWILSWRKYPTSKFATCVSFVGALTRYGGVLCFVYGEIVAGIICFAIGIGIHYCAEAMAFSAWKKLVRKEGFEERIKQGDLQIAAEIINGLSDKKAQDYIISLNPKINTILVQPQEQPQSEQK